MCVSLDRDFVQLRISNFVLLVNIICEYYLAVVILCIICYISVVYLLYKILFFYYCNYFCWRIEILSLAHEYSPAQSAFIPGA
jgi:hypothetical protein